MITPILIPDSKEKWRPLPVDESLAVYGYIWDKDAGKWLYQGDPVDKINFPKDMSPDSFGNLPTVGYRHEVKGGGLTWQQFWTWWPYNPKQYAGTGAHEGDWEFVQIGYTDAECERPVLMSVSQHNGGEKREFWRTQLDIKKRQPLVYVARDSHANYFGPSRDVTDIADGKGAPLKIEWKLFRTWYKWPGKWGNSNNSPGPLHSRRAWTAPHAWHGQARG
jgi:hypothetical protein